MGAKEGQKPDLWETFLVDESALMAQLSASHNRSRTTYIVGFSWLVLARHLFSMEDPCKPCVKGCTLSLSLMDVLD